MKVKAKDHKGMGRYAEKTADASRNLARPSPMRKAPATITKGYGGKKRGK